MQPHFYWLLLQPALMHRTGHSFYGIGYGGPVVKGGKVYLLDRDDKVGDNLWCFELSTGKELWNFAYNAPGEIISQCPLVYGDHTKPPLLVDGYFYARYSTNNRRDGLVCMSMDGQII